MNIFDIVKRQKNKMIGDLKNRVEIAKTEREADVYNRQMAKGQARAEARKIEAREIIKQEKRKAKSRIEKKYNRKGILSGTPGGGVFGSGSSGGIISQEPTKESVASKGIRNIWDDK